MSFIGTVTNYITDVTPAEERTATLSTVFPFMGIGAMVGTLSAGFLESTFGFQVVLLFSFCAELIALLFVAFFVKDVLPPKKDDQTKSILSEIKSGASVLFQDNTKGNRKRLLPLVFSDVVNMAFIMCEGSLMMLYTNRPPFNWTSNAFGFYAAAKQVAGVLGQVFGTGIIIKFIGTQNVQTDFTILQIGVSMNIVVALITAFSNSSVMLLLAIPFCFLAGPAQSAGGSLTSKLVSSDKKGSYTAFTSFITTFLAPMISSFYNQLYSSSVTSGIPGLVFIIHASALMAVVLLLRFGKQGLEDDETYKQEQGKGKGKGKVI
ncbi:putative proton-coupled folate transporter [Apostichopus japonicus]|uniref:Putative proton-coupled folate transporter n=1 Tax=Stichopus japonicus TaxID=307972 RepID=A0A2G8L2C1_STIJA|nr:putative proton-coupled folate transporter [Apostichopus japonicus]